MRKSATVLLCVVLLTSGLAFAQRNGEVLLERLGYAKSAKLLIVHADDIGMSHSVNVASFEALQKGWVSSGSIMVPCPWFNEAAEFARQHPEYDLGLHLTLTAEWHNYRWGPVSKSGVGTLIDGEGYFPRDTSAIGATVDVKEAASEIAAQAEKARSAGIRYTHFDNHMGALSQSTGLFGAYVGLGRKMGLPVSFSEGEAKGYSKTVQVEDLPMPLGIHAGDGQDQMESLRNVFSSLAPGVYMMVVHLGHDDPELRAIMLDEAGTAAGRQRDYDLVSSPEFHRLLSENGITLIGWKDLSRRK